MFSFISPLPRLGFLLSPELPIPGSVQSHVGRGFEQDVESFLVHGRNLELDELESPFQSRPF